MRPEAAATLVPERVPRGKPEAELFYGPGKLVRRDDVVLEPSAFYSCVTEPRTRSGTSSPLHDRREIVDASSGKRGGTEWARELQIVLQPAKPRPSPRAGPRWPSPCDPCASGTRARRSG